MPLAFPTKRVYGCLKHSDNRKRTRRNATPYTHVLRIPRLKSIPISEPVGNGLCAVPHPKGRNRYRQTPAPQSPVQKLPPRGSWQGAALTDEAAGQPETFQKQQANPYKRPPIVSFRPEWRNPPRGRKYQHMVKSATWEDSSTPFHYARNDMSGVIPFCPHRL